MPSAFDLNDHLSLCRLALKEVVDTLKMFLYVLFEGGRDLNVASCVFKFHGSGTYLKKEK